MADEGLDGEMTENPPMHIHAESNEAKDPDTSSALNKETMARALEHVKTYEMPRPGRIVEILESMRAELKESE